MKRTGTITFRTYTDDHPPSYARVHHLLGGFSVTWFWPEKPLTKDWDFSKGCGHLHRSWTGAWSCAATRVDRELVTFFDMNVTEIYLRSKEGQL